MKNPIRREAPEHLKDLRGDYLSGHTSGRHKEAAENQMLVRLKFIIETLNVKGELEREIMDVLESHNQANLNASAAREKITEEIISKLENLIRPNPDFYKDIEK